MDTVQTWFDTNQTMLSEYAIKIIGALLIFWIGKWVASILSSTVNKVFLQRKVDPIVASFLGRFIHAALLIFVVVAAISHMGFNTNSFIAVLGAAGLAIGLALKDSLSNFASGVLLVAFRPFKAGDFVEVAGIAGTVEELLIFATKLKTGDNKEVTIPNAAITGGAIVNYSAKPTRRVDLLIGVSYDADLKQTKQLLTEIVVAHSLVLSDPAPTIAVSELADSSVNFVVRAWTKTPNYWPVYFDLTENIKTGLDDAGIEIPYPHMSVVVNKNDKQQ